MASRRTSVAGREQGRVVPAGPARRVSVTDPFLEKLEELVDRSKGKIRADVAHDGSLCATGWNCRPVVPGEWLLAGGPLWRAR
jgi:hypothetical protein